MKEEIIWCERDTCLCCAEPVNGRRHCTLISGTGDNNCPLFEDMGMCERRMSGLDRRALNPDVLIETMGNFDIYKREYYPGWQYHRNEPLWYYYGRNKDSGRKTFGYSYLDQLKRDLPTRKDYATDDIKETCVYNAIKGTSLDAEIAAETGMSMEEVKEAAGKLAGKNMVRMRTIKKDDGLHVILTKAKR